MKIHPVKVDVTYTSGRTETLTFKEDWPSHEASLKDAMKRGAVRRFSYQRACDTSKQEAFI